jgi:hypothetical protein
VIFPAVRSVCVAVRVGVCSLQQHRVRHIYANVERIENRTLEALEDIHERKPESTPSFSSGSHSADYLLPGLNSG